VDISERDLKNDLSEYLRRMQAGEDIIVTSRGKRVARLSAVAEPPVQDHPEGTAIACLRALP
jgi:prevent-host-death family protein